MSSKARNSKWPSTESEFFLLQLLESLANISAREYERSHIWTAEKGVGRHVKQFPQFFAEICFVFEILCMQQHFPLLYCRDEDDEARVAFLHSRTWWNIWCSSRMCKFILSLVILKTSTCCVDIAVDTLTSALVRKKSNTGQRLRQCFLVLALSLKTRVQCKKPHSTFSEISHW